MVFIILFSESRDHHLTLRRRWHVEFDQNFEKVSGV